MMHPLRADTALKGRPPHAPALTSRLRPEPVPVAQTTPGYRPPLPKKYQLRERFLTAYQLEARLVCFVRARLALPRAEPAPAGGASAGVHVSQGWLREGARRLDQVGRRSHMGVTAEISTATTPIWKKWRSQSMPAVSRTPKAEASALPAIAPTIPTTTVSHRGMGCRPGTTSFASSPMMSSVNDGPQKQDG